MGDPAVERMEAEWASLRELLGSLDDAEWELPTALPGWSVKDCVSHVTGTERMIMGDPAPEIDVSGLDHVKNDFGVIVEVWVAERRPWPAAQVLAELDEQIPRRAAELRSMSDEQLAEVVPSPLGAMPYRAFLDVRVFDTWMHEQDIRRAVGRPGHLDGPAVDVALERFKGGLGRVIGKGAGAPDGTTVVFELPDGPVPALAFEVDGRARPVDEVPDRPTVRITVPFETLVALGGGRVAADEVADGVRVEGDADLGHRILTRMAFTP